MTVEELLKPRYKVIAAYPKSRLEVGKILTIEGDIDDIDGFAIHPHLFKKLEWWEERNIEDMPQYAKTPAGNSVRRIESINPQWGTLVFVGGKVRKIKQWLPATEEEFLKYTNGLQLNHHK